MKIYLVNDEEEKIYLSLNHIPQPGSVIIKNEEEYEVQGVVYDIDKGEILIEVS